MHFSLNLILFYIFVGALLNPSASEDPLEDINERIQSNLSAQALLIEALKQPMMKHKREGLSSMVDGIDILVSSSSPMKGNMTSQNDANTSFDQIKPNSFTMTDAPDNIDKSSAVAIDSATKMGKKDKLESGSTTSTPRTLRAFRGADPPPDTSTNDMAIDMTKVVDSEEDFLEDGLSTITADEYVRMRLIPTLAEFTSKAPMLSMSVYVVKLVGIILSVGSSILA